jgi:16S rRNA pseudouridine516 synthase
LSPSAPCRRDKLTRSMPRLEQLLARNLAGSRADARRLVLRHAVADHLGRVLADPRLEIPAARLPLVIRVDDRDVALYDEAHVVLHKPVGCVTALSDPVHPVASNYVRNAPLADELRAVGRLDLDTSGLLLWTTDGGWLQRLTHPKRRVPRTYQAALVRPFTPPVGTLVLHDGHQPQIEALAMLDAGSLHPALARPADARVYATITLIGGAYHEVRRIFAALDSHVVALCRVAFGHMSLPPDLPAGHWQEIRPERVWPAAQGTRS